MLTLQQLLQSDSISSMIDKLNANFQSLALSGGGPQGIPGEQGIPGLPGRIGPIGSTGPAGPTGSVVGIIPFGSTAGGNTGPTGLAGPWNTYSYQYLQTVVGTGNSHVGNIYIDHWNHGFWQYRNQPDATGPYTQSPYSNSSPGTPPPGGTGYFAGAGWYFYPMSGGSSSGSTDGVWANDTTTYQTAPPYAVGPTAGNFLTVKNARLLSKYGTVWISSGNAVDLAGNVDDNNLVTPTLYDWGVNPSNTLPQPSRYNSGIDRLYFKQSIDTLPYLSNVTARSYSFPSGTIGGAPDEENNQYPDQGSGQMIDYPFWVKPLYDATIADYSPLQYYTERRDNASYPSGSIFGSLGLYMYSGVGSVPGPGGYTYAKSLFVYSTRVSENPDENTGSTPINGSNTFNVGEMLLDVKRLTTSNQFVCSIPSDLYMSEDDIVGPNIVPGPRSYSVTQGYISAVNGKAITGAPENLNILNYGNLTVAPSTGTTAVGNYTRSSFFGSAFFQSPGAWSSQLDSGNPANTTDTHTADSMYRLAGMRERGRKIWNSSNDNYFLNELIFYTSQFTNNNPNHIARSEDLDATDNDQHSYGAFYVSPWRNFGIGTFTNDQVGVFEPAARFQSIARVLGNEVDAGDINPSVANRSGDYLTYPSKVYKSGAFTAVDESGLGGFTGKYVDVYLGETLPLNSERANPLLASSSYVNKATNILDIALRRESWSVNVGTGNISTLRLGVKPLTSTASSSTIGATASKIPHEFPFAITPLNPINGTAEIYSSPLGFGLHNVYPRARVHLFGKNSINELKTGNEPWSPGFNILKGQTPNYTGTTGTYPYYPFNTASSGEVVIDKLMNSYTYPAGIYEYPYEVFGLPSGTANPEAVGGTGSPNAANYPWREFAAPTRTTSPWGLTGRNYSYGSSTGRVNGAYQHGSLFQGENSNEGNLYVVDQYIGFNLFRDLLNTGDNADTTRWRTGSSLYENGGSAILGNSFGDMAFVNIPSKRDGGEAFKGYEQQGLSTRDIVNNIKLVISQNGDVGIGNKPGLDVNAYGTLERSLVSGNVFYTPVTDARNNPPEYAKKISATRWPYALVNYSGLSATYAETSSTSAAAAINRWTTEKEYIKLEVGAEKFYGKNSRSSLKAGYGYPPNLTLSISGASIRNYLLLNWASYTTAGGSITSIILFTDYEGRISKIWLTGATTYVDITPYFTALVLPHPTEFNSTSGTPWARTGFTAPAGACAPSIYENPAAWQSNLLYGPPGLEILDGSFVNETIGTANMRLNNFVAGEGMNVSISAGQQAVADQVKAARQKSPKIILSFLEADNTTIPGTSRDKVYVPSIGKNRPVSGTAAYRKVNTVIASAQNESAVREYWIPKTDNTGGTFMVFTDHYGQKEKDSGFDSVTINSTRFYVEEVVTLEFVSSYTGTAGTTATRIIASPTDAALNISKSTDPNFNSTSLWGHQVATATPLYVKYLNSQMGNSKYGITGTKNNLFQPTEYGMKVKVLGSGMTGAITGVGPDGSPAGSYYGYSGGTGTSASLINIGLDGATAASILRNVDKFYSLNIDTTNWDNGWYETENTIQNRATGFRFKRINSDFALVDFNMTVNVNNPDISTGFSDDYTTADNLIDFGSPRWTQYIRLTYMPAYGLSNDRDYLADQYGNGLSFMNWSSFNQWYPGVAIANDSNILPGDSLTNTGGPQYTLDRSWESHNQNLTWSGNFIDAGLTRQRVSPGNEFDAMIPNNVNTQMNDPFPFDSNGPSTGAFFNGLNMIPKFAGSYFQANISKSLALLDNTKSMALSYRFGHAHSLFGNEWLSRSRHCMWRLVPRIGNHYGDGVDAGNTYQRNNSFTLEIMFDTPILHIDTPFPQQNFSGGGPSQTVVNPYQNLTISGQAMVRYNDNTRTYYNGGYTASSSLGAGA